MPLPACSPGAMRASSTSSVARSYGFWGASHGAKIAIRMMRPSVTSPTTASLLSRNCRAKRRNGVCSLAGTAGLAVSLVWVGTVLALMAQPLLSAMRTRGSSML
ncbi:hypothetical protein D3C85_1536500 [compost metagenome]